MPLLALNPYIRSDHIDTPWADAEYDMRKRSAFLDMKDSADRKALFEKHIASLAKKMGVSTTSKAQQGSSDESANASSSSSSQVASATSTAAVEEAKPKEDGEEEDGEEKDDDEEELQGKEASAEATTSEKKRTLPDSEDSEVTKKTKN